MLQDMGIETGVSLERVLEVSAEVQTMIGHSVPSQVSKAGPRWAVGG